MVGCKAKDKKVKTNEQMGSCYNFWCGWRNTVVTVMFGIMSADCTCFFYKHVAEMHCTHPAFAVVVAFYQSSRTLHFMVIGPQWFVYFERLQLPCCEIARPVLLRLSFKKSGRCW